MKLGVFVEYGAHYEDHCLDLIRVLNKENFEVLTYSQEVANRYKNSYLIKDLSKLSKDRWGVYSGVIYPGDVRLGLNCKGIHINHGTSDKEYQLGLPLKEYHLVLLPGQRDYDRLEKRGLISSNTKIVGYMKFDRLNTMENIKLFDNDNKTILYAPTWDTNFKEMTKISLKLIEIVNKNKYNLIIKPHPGILSLMTLSNNIDVLLVMRDKIEKSDNVRFIKDYHSLEYLKISDLLITGVSSMTYESLVFNIPIIFNNATGVFPNYSNITSTTYAWNSGYVCNDIDNLEWLIKDSLDNPNKFEKRRKELFDYSFYKPDEGKACERAKMAIEELLA